jgi:hypothetical protein
MVRLYASGADLGAKGSQARVSLLLCCLQVATEAGKVAMQAADPALRTPTPPAGMNKPTSGDIDMEHSTAVARLGRLKRCSTTVHLPCSRHRVPFNYKFTISSCTL